MVPNSNFVTFVCNKRQAWEIGGNKTPDQIIAESLTIYNNAISMNGWDTKDPKDVKIMALTTQVEQSVVVQQQVAAFTTQNKADSLTLQDTSRNGDYMSIKAWRMKKTEDILQKEGKTWYLCPHHKVEASYDGLYVTHKSEEHKEWKKNKF